MPLICTVINWATRAGLLLHLATKPMLVCIHAIDKIQGMVNAMEIHSLLLLNVVKSLCRLPKVACGNIYRWRDTGQSFHRMFCAEAVPVPHCENALAGSGDHICGIPYNMMACSAGRMNLHWPGHKNATVTGTGQCRCHWLCKNL